MSDTVGPQIMAKSQKGVTYTMMESHSTHSTMHILKAASILMELHFARSTAMLKLIALAMAQLLTRAAKMVVTARALTTTVVKIVELNWELVLLQHHHRAASLHSLNVATLIHSNSGEAKFGVLKYAQPLEQRSSSAHVRAVATL